MSQRSHLKEPDFHDPGGIRSGNSIRQAAADLHVRPCSYPDRHSSNFARLHSDEEIT